MRLVYWLEAHKCHDPEQLQQFESCLLASRMTDPKCPIHVYVPEGFYWPQTWQTLTNKGVTLERTGLTQAAALHPGDQLTLGTHMHIHQPSRVSIPNAKATQLQPPARLVTLAECAAWCDEQRAAGQRSWFRFQPNAQLQHTRPHMDKHLPLEQWLNYAYWLKAQPRRYNTSENYVWQKKRFIVKPTRSPF